MKRVTEASLPEARAFLKACPEDAMMPLSYLQRYGLDGQAPEAPRMWMSGSGVLTFCRKGIAFPNCPPAEAAKILAGQNVRGIVGPTALCRPLISMLGLDAGPHERDGDEPQFSLDLNDLNMPEGPGALAPLEAAPKNTMIAWRSAFCHEALGHDRKTAEIAAQAAYERCMREDTYRVLVDGNQPLATTGFDAQVKQIVLIGGVYTPPALRNQGHARRALALHLLEARQNGIQRATLFARGAAAQRAYEAIGFKQIGSGTFLIRPEKMSVPQ